MRRRVVQLAQVGDRSHLFVNPTTKEYDFLVNFDGVGSTSKQLYEQ